MRIALMRTTAGAQATRYLAEARPSLQAPDDSGYRK
jgi:hypothetical protein